MIYILLSVEAILGASWFRSKRIFPAMSLKMVRDRHGREAKGIAPTEVCATLVASRFKGCHYPRK
jgi:hypothetical protein